LVVVDEKLVEDAVGGGIERGRDVIRKTAAGQGAEVGDGGGSDCDLEAGGSDCKVDGGLVGVEWGRGDRVSHDDTFAWVRGWIPDWSKSLPLKPGQLAVLTVDNKAQIMRAIPIVFCI
jgi:hypothetical protein